MRTITGFLQFRPRATAVIGALVGWTVLLAALVIFWMVTTAVIGAVTRPQQLQLRGISSFVAESARGWGYIRFDVRDFDCAINAARTEVACVGKFKGQPLQTVVTLHDDTLHEGIGCTAAYDGTAVPCHAGFEAGAPPTRAFVLLESNLGLTDTEFAAMAAETADVGWQERDWLRLGVLLSTGVALLALAGLWRHSGRRVGDVTGGCTIWLRLIYSGGVSTLIWAAAQVIVLWTLLALNLVD